MMKRLLILLVLVACGDSNPVPFTWTLGDGTYTFSDSLNGKLRNSFGGQWWVRDPRFFVETESSGIISLSLEIRGESLYDEEIQVVLSGIRYRVEK